MATGHGSIKIPSRGDTTPEYNAALKSCEEIEPAIIPDDFVRRAHSRGLLPTRNLSRPPLDVILNEISRDPVNYYSLQHVLATTLNVGNRFNDGISKMETTFQLEMKKYIPAGSSEDPTVEPENCPKVFISFSRRKVLDDSPDALTEAKGLYAELKAQGCKPWMDENELEFGDVLAMKIFWAIKQCDFIIAIMTGGYATSLLCLRELYYAALQKDPKRPKTIIPMLLEGEAVIDHQNAGKWLLRIGTVHKYFKREEKAAMVKSLKDKIVNTEEPDPSNDNFPDGNFQAECNPIADTNAQALSANQSPQDNFSPAIGTSSNQASSGSDSEVPVKKLKTTPLAHPHQHKRRRSKARTKLSPQPKTSRRREQRLKEELSNKPSYSGHKQDNLLDGTFQAECNPIPINQINTNTNAQAPSANQSPQDNFSPTIGTSEQRIASLHSSNLVPHTDTSPRQSISFYSSIQARTSELNPRDREAILRSSANEMKKKFASLLVDIIISFKDRGIDPQDITSCILALTEYDDPAIGKPLLERQKEKLRRAKNVNRIFDIVRPHMTFFNHEILEFIIEKIGSRNDKHNLQTFLDEFNDFCRRSVFEIPPNTLGHGEENAADKQKFHVKITNEFKAAFLVQSQEYDKQATSSNPTSSDHEERKRICTPELGISLEDAKYIQRKLAKVLNLKASSIYLDSATPGCVILTFLLPSHISLAGLDSNPDAIALSDIGIRILCGPPGKPEPKELTSKGLIVQWSRPEYGCSSLKRYILYYQRKDNETTLLNDWQKIELSSQQTHACVPDFRDGDTYIFRVSSVSDAGTLQYSDESEIANPETLLACSSADPSSAWLASFEANVEDVSLLGEEVKVVTEKSKTSMAQRRLADLIASIPESISGRWTERSILKTQTFEVAQYRSTFAGLWPTGRAK